MAKANFQCGHRINSPTFIRRSNNPQEVQSLGKLKITRSQKKTILLITAAATITFIINATIATWLSRTTSLNIPSVGNIRTLGVEAYWDPNLTNRTTELMWPTVSPGASKNVTLYLQSASNIKTILEFQTSNWIFRSLSGAIVLESATSTRYMNLTWNYNNTAVDPGQTLQVALTLSIDSSIDFIWFLIDNNVKEFSFDIIISTSEYSQ